MPYWSTEIETSLPPHEVGQRVSNLLLPKQDFWESLESATARPSKQWLFKGEVAGRTFKITRVIGYRNSFLPVVLGAISERANGGTTVRLRMRLSAFTGIFLIVWIAVAASSIPLGDFDGSSAILSLPAGMIAFAILITAGGFYFEAVQAERLLRHALVP